jgi:hypothetical protein
VRILLDENFPLQLHQRLLDRGVPVEHIILLGQRGLPDEAIRARLHSEPLLFLTQDTEFLESPQRSAAVVIVSRVDQALPIRERVEIWNRAIEHYLDNRPKGEVFELLTNGRLLPWAHMKRED